MSWTKRMLSSPSRTGRSGCSLLGSLGSTRCCTATPSFSRQLSEVRLASFDVVTEHPRLITRVGLGKWSAPQAQALTVPCYILGAISYLLVARLSDAHQLRGLYQIIFASLCIIGYGTSIADASPAVHYFATFMIAMGLFVAVGIPLAWLPSNNPRYGKRTTASAIQIMVCNCSGISAPFVSLTPPLFVSMI